jgi:hypothetical protein
LPEDYDGLCLGGQHMGRGPEKIKPGVVRCLNTQRTHAYSAKGAYMKALYELWVSPETNVHIDWRLGHIQPQHRIYAPDPFLIAQERSKSDINGRLNPRQSWNPPSPDAPTILFRGPREVLEGMRAYGWHIGHDRDLTTGIDKGLLAVFQSDNPARKLKDWMNTLQWEAASIEGSTVVVWHPLATAEVCREAWTGPVHEIAAETIEEILNTDMNEPDYVSQPCPCKEGDACPHYCKRLVGRLWQLSRDMTEQGRKYRAVWVDMCRHNPQMGELPNKPAMPRKPCNCKRKV